MERTSFLLLQSKGKQNAHLMRKAIKNFYSVEEQDDGEFLKAYKAIWRWNNDSSQLHRQSFNSTLIRSNSKGEETDLIPHIEALTRGLDNNSSEENRQLFISHKMHIVLVTLLNANIDPRNQMEFLSRQYKTSNKVIVSILEMLSKLVNVKDEHTFHTEIAYYDPLIV